jgi:hypothetical protein
MTLTTADPRTTTADQPGFEAALGIDHPAWCSPRRCTVRPGRALEDGVHLSTAVVLDAPLTVTGALTVQAWLHQTGDGNTTYLVLDAPDIDCGRALLPVDEAAPTIGMLQQLIATAGATR